MAFDIDKLITTSVSNKFSEKVDSRLEKIILQDFISLNNMWSKALAIFLLERADSERLANIGKKIHMEIKFLDQTTYDRFIAPYIKELKKAFTLGAYTGPMDHIVEALVDQGEREYIIINKLIYNCIRELYFGNKFVNRKTFPVDMRNKIEQEYDIN